MFFKFVVNFFGKVDLFAPILGDIEAIIRVPLTWLDLKKNLKKKKKKSTCPPLLKKVVEDNQTIIF